MTQAGDLEVTVEVVNIAGESRDCIIVLFRVLVRDEVICLLKYIVSRLTVLTDGYWMETRTRLTRPWKVISLPPASRKRVRSGSAVPRMELYC